MLQAFTPLVAEVPATSMWDTLQQLGLTSGVQTCLDASVSGSYSGSGQTWTDLSGNGNNFFRGTTSGAEASDPTFNGTAGNQSKNEYWGLDGADLFQFNTTNPAWINNLHKSAQTWTMLTWVNLPSLGSTEGVFGTNGGSSGANIGIFMVVRSTNIIRVGVSNGTTANNTDSTITVGSTGWHMIAASMVITNASNCFMQIDGTSETVAAGIPSPSASAAAFTGQIAAGGNSTAIMINSSRMGNFTAWNTQLTSAQLTAIYNATKDKFV